MLTTLTGLLLGAAVPAGQHSSCSTTTQILAMAKVAALPTVPAGLDLQLQATGLLIKEADYVAWPTCRVRLQQRVFGGWAITDTGVPVWPANSSLITRDKIPQHRSYGDSTCGSIYVSPARRLSRSMRLNLGLRHAAAAVIFRGSRWAGLGNRRRRGRVGAA